MNGAQHMKAGHKRNSLEGKVELDDISSHNDPARRKLFVPVDTNGATHIKTGHKRNSLEARVGMDDRPSSHDNAAGAYKSVRQSLRPLSQAPNNPSPPQHRVAPDSSYQYGAKKLAVPQHGENARPLPQRQPPADMRLDYDEQNSPSAIQFPHQEEPSHQPSHTYHHSLITTPDLGGFKKSTTSHLRNLSQFAENGEGGGFSIHAQADQVTGLHGRRRLQRAGSTRPGKVPAPLANRSTYGFGERNWIDKQRQFLQAYEYLCHIGEAKEWIEDIIRKPIPPIVQLEEGLRDGVTLAEIVQALHPEQPLRIFRHPKLQFRHSDNIALFFRFLGDIELPELFRFELIDLYEKKNIPKVIYCIHALSWILFRNGIVDFRIGNLVGQLEFEHHELEEVQKGLDKAGISMPVFHGMGSNFGAEPEPEPEPVETEEDRVQRELSENEDKIADFQAQIRGAMVRVRLGDVMQNMWDSEALIIDLQSRIRGDFSRQIADYRLGMKRFAVNLQSASRGFLVRSKQVSKAETWKAHEIEVIRLQSIFRGNKARARSQGLKTRLQDQTRCITHFQASIRGALERKRVEHQHQQTTRSSDTVAKLQASIRGNLARKAVANQRFHLRKQQNKIVDLQRLIRGCQVRRRVEDQWRDLEHSEDQLASFQAMIRGRKLRQDIQQQTQKLRVALPATIKLQAAGQGALVRSSIARQTAELRAAVATDRSLSAAITGMLVRGKIARDIQRLKNEEEGVKTIQAAARGVLLRENMKKLNSELHGNLLEIVALQSIGRAMMCRLRVGADLEQLDDQEDSICALQTFARGAMLRARFAEKKRFFNENMEKVVKVQSFVRSRMQGQAYKSLISGDNPPVGTVKNFVHLLNDSDFDFDEEIEFERMRKKVVQQVRQNETVEQYIDQIDVKIALLVKNKITLDEVIKHQRHFGTKTTISSRDPFDLRALNSSSRKKLEHYQQLFFTLQTQPQYLARLFTRFRDKAISDSECKRMEHLMMGLFGYAQKRREEYYLLKLVSRSIHECTEKSTSMDDWMRQNMFWGKLVGNYVRSPRDRKYMREVLGPLIRENILENEALDLESDPIQIYRSAINNEELRTGQRSQRRLSISREEAIRDPETRRTFTDHLQDLRDIVDQFMVSFNELLGKIPYGIRYICLQMFRALCKRFPEHGAPHLTRVVGHWFWKSYLCPALTQPENWGVVERGLKPLQKRNLGEVAKVFARIALASPFDEQDVFLQPLNNFIDESVEPLTLIWHSMLNIEDAEAHFDIDDFNDLYARQKPTLYVKMADIFAIHNLIVTEISFVCPNKDDPVRELVQQLGSPQKNETEMADSSMRNSEIGLTLNPKLHETEDPEADVKTLFTETKRCVLYIIRIQTGGDLMNILVKPISEDDDNRWAALVREELAAGTKRRGAYSEVNANVDIASMSYYELKRTALENVLMLEKLGKLTRRNAYQDLLNVIAVDIRTKHRRRVQRHREVEAVQLTLDNLNEKAVWLEQQLSSYNNYIEQAMLTLQSRKGNKKRFLLPFTKQYNHVRELQRSGRVPKFGSYKYSAHTLTDRGIIIAYEGYDERQLDKVNITISSDKVGVFSIEGSIGSIQIPGASDLIDLDTLLGLQFDNCQTISVFEKNLKFNLNLLLHMLFKKFYRDE
ncbi:MAG: AAA+-type ATPase [Chaenotheca gracillima]|nr:MAG: AAA+-type ATPase [Chaenotheca gracillima]